MGYNPVRFDDVSGSAWYCDAVSFIAARGITEGMGNGCYSPDASLSRGQFIVMLIRTFGISPDTGVTDNFSDAGNTYYTGYLAAAKRLGIASGIGNNQFAPEKAITRQEMFTLLYNALKAIDRLPDSTSGRTIADFSDASEIASWALEAMTLLVETGMVSGSGGNLDPTGITTRAEMSQVLYRLITQSYTV